MLTSSKGEFRGREYGLEEDAFMFRPKGQIELSVTEHLIHKSGESKKEPSSLGISSNSSMVGKYS